MHKALNPDKMKIGYAVLIAGRKPTVEKLQRKLGFGERSRWTHIAGCLGGYDAIEAAIPCSRVFNLQKKYVDKGYEVKVLSRKAQHNEKRYKIALWWATMNNIPYDILQFLWFPLAVLCGRIGLRICNLISSRKRLVCSELIANGFYKEGDYLFAKSAQHITPADFDDPVLFDEITDIWLGA